MVTNGTNNTIIYHYYLYSSYLSHTMWLLIYMIYRYTTSIDIIVFKYH